MTHLPLGPGREFERIRAIEAALGAKAVALGDDCALIPLDNGDMMALSTDTSLEGTHFRRDWLTPEEIGWRAAASALSDLAAEGADVIGLLAALTLPGDVTDDMVTAIMSGVGACVSEVGGKVLGGDLTRGTSLSLTVTVVGRAPRAVTRRGAKARRRALGDRHARERTRRAGCVGFRPRATSHGAHRVRASTPAHRGRPLPGGRGGHGDARPE